MVYGRKQVIKQTFKHTYAHAQCSIASVGLAQAHSNKWLQCILSYLNLDYPTLWLLNAKFHKPHPHLQKPHGSWRLWNQCEVPKKCIDSWREAGYLQAHGYRSRRFKITYNNVRIQQQNVYYGCLGLQHFLASSMRQVHIQIGTRMRIHSVPVCNMATVLGWNCPCCLRRSEVA